MFDIVTELGVTGIDALKIDVEGYESEALIPFFEAAPRTLWPKIMVIEDCHRDRWRQDLFARLLKIGYQTRSRTKSHAIFFLTRS